MAASTFDFSKLTLQDTVERTSVLAPDMIDGIKSRVRQLDKFPMEATKTRNIIMLGRSGSGKSTACSILMDICAQPGKKSLFSETVDPGFRSFSLDDVDSKMKYTLNVIDTPGVQEVKPKGESARSDTAILDTIKYCLKNEITKIHVLFIFASFETRITPLDISAFKIYLDMFYDEQVQIAFCITRAEWKDEEWKRDVIKDLSQDSYFQDILQRPNVHTFFAGCVEEGIIKSMPDPGALFARYNEVANLRKLLIQYIFNAKDDGVPLLSLPIVSASRKTMEDIFDVQEGLLNQLLNSPELNTGPLNLVVDHFASNVDYMIENEALFSDKDLFARFQAMKEKMRVVAPRMKEEMRIKFTSKIIGV